MKIILAISCMFFLSDVQSNDDLFSLTAANRLIAAQPDKERRNIDPHILADALTKTTLYFYSNCIRNEGRIKALYRADKIEELNGKSLLLLHALAHQLSDRQSHEDEKRSIEFELKLKDEQLVNQTEDTIKQRKAYLAVALGSSTLCFVLGLTLNLFCC